MKLEIYKTSTPGEYSWRLMAKGREIARMPDGTAAPSKIKRTVLALAKHSSHRPLDLCEQVGKTWDSELAMACHAALREFELLHPTHEARRQQ